MAKQPVKKARHIDHPFFDYGPLHDMLEDSVPQWNWEVSPHWDIEDDTLVLMLCIELYDHQDDASEFSYANDWDKKSNKARKQWRANLQAEKQRINKHIRPLIVSWMQKNYPHFPFAVQDEPGDKDGDCRLYVINGPKFGMTKHADEVAAEVHDLLKQI